MGHWHGGMVADDDRRYRAPALEKGLDVLELLALAPQPMTASAIVNQLGRSHGELFRMLQVLAYRGFIEQDPVTDGYRLTDRLFSLGMQQPRTRNLVELALPVMRDLSMKSGQSCHLAFHTGGDMVVVARMESAEQLGFSVRVGYRRPLSRTVSGRVLYAFQEPAVRQRWEAMMTPPPAADAIAALRDAADGIRATGYDMADSPVVSGIVDLSAPILRDGSAAAALTIPFIERHDSGMDRDGAVRLLIAAAARLSAGLTAVDARL